VGKAITSHLRGDLDKGKRRVRSARPKTFVWMSKGTTCMLLLPSCSSLFPTVCNDIEGNGLASPFMKVYLHADSW